MSVPGTDPALTFDPVTGQGRYGTPPSYNGRYLAPRDQTGGLSGRYGGAATGPSSRYFDASQNLLAGGGRYGNGSFTTGDWMEANYGPPPTWGELSQPFNSDPVAPAPADGASVTGGGTPDVDGVPLLGTFTSEKPVDAAMGSPASAEWTGVNQWDESIWGAVNEIYDATGIWVDPNRIKAHMKIESDGVAGAVQNNPTGNAYGLMQVTANASVAPYLMQLLGTNDWNVVAQALQSDPDFAIFAGALELANRYSQYGDWNMASQAYFGFDTQDAANGTTSAQYITTLNDYLVQLTTFTEGGQVYVPEVDEGTQLVPGDMQGGVDASYEGVSLGITSIAKLDSMEWQSQGFGMTGFARDNTSTELSLDQRCVAAGNGTGKMYDYAACYGFEGHPGIDLGYARGTAISSPVSGTVEVVGVRPDGTRTYVDNSGAPNSGELMLRLDNGDVIIFGHMAQIDVVPGQRINAGDHLGLSGTQGTGDHLHLEVRVKDPNRDDVYYIADPYQYLGY